MPTAGIKFKRNTLFFQRMKALQEENDWLKYVRNMLNTNEQDAPTPHFCFKF